MVNALFNLKYQIFAFWTPGFGFRIIIPNWNPDLDPGKPLFHRDPDPKHWSHLYFLQTLVPNPHNIDQNIE